MRGVRRLSEASPNTENPWLTRGFHGGRYQTRTDDLFRVKEARYQLRQSPATTILPYSTGREARPRASDTRAPLGLESTPGWATVEHARRKASEMRMWRSGSASPCQGEGREFESRHPLEWSLTVHRFSGTWAAHLVAWPRGEAAACKAVHTGSNPVVTSKRSKIATSLSDWRSGSALP